MSEIPTKLSWRSRVLFSFANVLKLPSPDDFSESRNIKQADFPVLAQRTSERNYVNPECIMGLLSAMCGHQRKYSN